MAKFETLTELFADENWQELIETQLRELAAEKPDFQYTACSGVGIRCLYHCGPEVPTVKKERYPDFNWESDGCFFGQAFQRLGISKSELERNQRDISVVCKSFERKCPVSWELVQNSQDESKTWGEAIKHLN